ncbi:lipopolysaccharide biosynthesis protein [Curtobacterium citreum]|uniref:lipopolysaccharide biosynthesis protein n=1 Tax=Curtobacterium citreum TaxID=2036 RepID=UPI002542A9EB|nr:oligosaccharide flippase family protein [Curtobacterium citreum]WIJ45903.1 oligosaccharide flippase family protein [Curtobacterium citreum]
MSNVDVRPARGSRITNMNRQVIVLVGSRGLAAVLQSISFMLLSRVVDVRTFGAIGVLTALAGFALLVTDLGITATLSRARARADHGMVAGALRLNDVVTVVTAVLFAVIAGLSAAPHLALGLLALSLTLERNTETHLSVFFADGSSVVPAASILGRRLLMLAAFGGLLLVHADGAVAFALAQLVGVVFSQLLQRFTVKSVRGDIRAIGLRAVLAGSWRFWASSVLNQVRILDSAVVGAFASVASAGLYSAAQKLVNPMLLLPASLSQVILPAVAKSGSDAVRITRNVCLLLLSSYVVLLPVCFFASDLLRLLFGSPYAAAGPILIWALIGFPMLALSGPLAAILQGRHDEGFVAANGAAFAAVALAGMVLGAIWEGPVGVAAAMTICYALRTPVLVLRIVRKHGGGEVR